MKNVLLIIVFIFGVGQIQAQVDVEVDSVLTEVIEEREETPLTIAEDSLKELAKVIMQNQKIEEREAASEKFMEGLVAALNLEGGFDYSFDSLFNISKIYPADSTFRIMTWQMYINKDEYKYFGLIQTNGETSKIHILEDYSSRMKRVKELELTANNWYGALYYNMREFKSKGKKMYLLFGFDAFEFFEKRKVIEVLSFDENGEPVFGAPVIQYPHQSRNQEPVMKTYHRFVINYSAEASISLNYNEDLEMVIFDHLIAMGSNFPNIPYVMVPDGSYEGLKLKKGKWVYVEKIFDHKYELNEYPRPRPVLDNDKGLFGKGK